MITCKYCGAPLSDSSRFCQKCGAPVASTSTPVKTPAPTPAQEPTPTPPQEIAPEPIKEAAPEPVKEATLEPVKEVAPEPEQEPVAAPAKEYSPNRVQQAGPTRVQRAGASRVQSATSPRTYIPRLKSSGGKAIIIIIVLVMLVTGAGVFLILHKGSGEDHSHEVMTESGPIRSEDFNPDDDMSPATVGHDRYTLVEAPGDDDFAWFATIKNNGIPKDAKILTEMSEITGTWKALIYNDPERKYDSEDVELVNFDISGTKENVKLVIRWHRSINAMTNEELSTEDLEPEIFKGKWNSKEIYLTGSGNIQLTTFFEMGDMQYALGTSTAPDGVPGIICMVRP